MRKTAISLGMAAAIASGCAARHKPGLYNMTSGEFSESYCEVAKSNAGNWASCAYPSGEITVGLNGNLVYFTLLEADPEIKRYSVDRQIKTEPVPFRMFHGAFSPKDPGAVVLPSTDPRVREAEALHRKAVKNIVKESNMARE